MFPCLVIMSNAGTTIPVQVFVKTYVFNSLGYIPRKDIGRSLGNSMFQVSDEIPKCFPHQLYHLHPTQQCTSALISPHPYQRLLFWLFKIIAVIVLVGLKWYLILVLICISLMTNNIEHFLSTY